jgi:tetrahydromethanopterin S-methyltransferase subunit B
VPGPTPSYRWTRCARTLARRRLVHVRIPLPIPPPPPLPRPAPPLRQAIREIKVGMGSPEVRGKFDSDKARELHARTAASVAAEAAASTAYGRSNAAFIGSATAQLQESRAAQDEALAGLSSGLVRVSAIATAINDEIKEQDAIIDDTTKEMDETQAKMDSALAGIEKLLKTKDRCQLALIAGLVLAFIVVAIVAFYLLTK